MRLGMESVAIGGALLDPSVLDGRPHFAKKRLRDRFHWRPTPREERMIHELALRPPKTRAGLRLRRR